MVLDSRGLGRGDVRQPSRVCWLCWNWMVSDAGANSFDVRHTSYDGSTGRRNMEELNHGCSVRIKGLVSATQHNGKEGVLIIFDTANGRWGVEVGEAELLSVKPASLEFVREPVQIDGSRRTESRASGLPTARAWARHHGGREPTCPRPRRDRDRAEAPRHGSSVSHLWSAPYSIDSRQGAAGSTRVCRSIQPSGRRLLGVARQPRPRHQARRQGVGEAAKASLPCVPISGWARRLRMIHYGWRGCVLSQRKCWSTVLHRRLEIAAWWMSSLGPRV